MIIFIFTPYRKSAYISALLSNKCRYLSINDHSFKKVYKWTIITLTGPHILCQVSVFQGQARQGCDWAADTNGQFYVLWEKL